MTDQKIIDAYLNELVTAASALGALSPGRDIDIPLGDSVDTHLRLKTHSSGKRLSGIVDSLVTELKFELRIRHHHIEFVYPPAGPRAMLRGTVTKAPQPSIPQDSATLVATLARRLKHFAVMKRVRVGIRDSMSPPRTAELQRAS